MSDKSSVVGNMAESKEFDLEMDSDLDEVEEDTASTTPENIAITSNYGGSFKTFTYVNGRRYHSSVGSGEYFLPNDEQEQDRLDLYHYIYLVLLRGKLYLAPTKGEDLKMVLDVGTGTGIWATDMAGEYPNAHIIGTDISPIQPSWVPPQVTFEMVDMEGPWEKYYKPNTFDHINIRSMGGCFRDWDALLLQAFKHLKPGGYVEFKDYGCEIFHTSGTVPEDCKLLKFSRLCNMAGEMAGRPLTISRTMKERLSRLGFDDVQESVFIVPFGPWPKDKQMKELGRIGQVAVAESVETYSLELLSKYHNMDMDGIKKFCDEVTNEVKSVKGYYMDVFVVYGRKPLNWKES